MNSETAMRLLRTRSLRSTERGVTPELTHQTSGSVPLRSILASRASSRRGGGRGGPFARPATALNLQTVSTPYGEAAFKRCRRRLIDRHGERSPGSLLRRSVQRLVTLTSAPAAAPADPRRWVFVDTESTGLGGWAGNLAFILSFGYFDEDDLLGEQFVIDQLVVRSYDEEAAALYHAAQLTSRFGAVVTFNGRSFDAPLLRARAQMTGVSAALAELPHIDLLSASRRTFGHRLADSRLQTLEREVLGFSRVNDLPGHQVPKAWFEYQHTADPRPLRGVLEHNELDVLSLPVLAALLAEASDPAPPASYDTWPVRPSDRQAAHRALAAVLSRRAIDAERRDGDLGAALGHAEQARALLEPQANAAVDQRAKVERRIHRLQRKLDRLAA